MTLDLCYAVLIFALVFLVDLSRHTMKHDAQNTSYDTSDGAGCSVRELLALAENAGY